MNKDRTTAVIGKNGEGKSSCILDSIYFACFGKPFRNINIPNVVNSINNSDCMVELEVKVGKKQYKVRRGLKPKIFEIYEDGQLVDQDAHSRDYQEHLEKYVLGGMNERVFKQIVIMGSANFVPFMQLPSAARREVIEELLDIKIFSGMLDIAKIRLQAIKDQLLELDNSVTLTSEKIKLHDENQKRIETDSTKKIFDLQNKIDKENDDIQELNKEIKGIAEKKSSYLEKYSNFNAVMDSRRNLEKEEIEFNNDIKNAKKMIDFLENNTDCPTCKQSIEHNHKQGLLFTNGKELDVKHQCLAVNQEKIKKHNEILETLNKIKITIDNCDKVIYKKQTEITTKQKYIMQLQKEINQTSKSTQVVSNDIDALRKELDQFKNSRISILEERQYYEVISGLLKDGGIKTKIIRQYIPVFNKLINQYLVKFGLPIEFTLDAEFDEVIKSRYRDKFQYNNLSEGEKARVDIAIMLTWRNIAKSKNTLNTNLLIMDEVFDSHLDQNSTEALLEILTEMDKKTNIFVISHKNNLEEKLDKTLRFVKQGNFTQLQ